MGLSYTQEQTGLLRKSTFIMATLKSERNSPVAPVEAALDL